MKNYQAVTTAMSPYTLSENEFLILLALRTKPACGYGLITNAIFQLSAAIPARSTIYAILQRLRYRGLLKAKPIISLKNPQRLIYQLTAKGRLYLIHSAEQHLYEQAQKYQAAIKSLVIKRQLLRSIQDQLTGRSQFGNPRHISF